MVALLVRGWWIKMKQRIKNIKSRLRDIVGEGLHVSGLASPQLWARNKLTIVTFHRVLPPDLLAEYPTPEIVVTPDELDHFVRVLRRHYAVGNLHEMSLRYQAGEASDKPLLAITFDDGQADNHRFARPVLQTHGVKASFFVVTEAIEGNEALWPDRMAYAIQRALDRSASGLREWLLGMGATPGAKDLPNAAVALAKRLTPEERDQRLHDLEKLVGGQVRPAWDGMMSWDQLRDLQREGHEIGSHSASHPILPLVPDTALDQEIEGSRATLEQRLDQTVRSFCYPNGDHDERVIQAVRKAGYQHGVSTQYGLNSADSEPLALRRVDIQGRFGRNTKGGFSSGPLMLRLSGLLPGAS